MVEKAFEGRQTYGREGDRLFGSVWGELQTSLQVQLPEYKAVDKSLRLELRAEKNQMTIRDVTIRCYPQNRSIQISGLGSGMECLSLPLNGVSLNKLVQQILAPILFPELTAVVKFV